MQPETTDSIKKIIAWIVSLQVIGFLIGLLTKKNITSWYIHLNKSPINPPHIIFPIAWSFLYITIAIAGFLLFESKSDRDIFYSKLFFSIQLILNWLWTPLFFGTHNIMLGFYWIILILAFTFLSILFAFKKCKVAAFLLMPYFLWLIFACYLSFFIFMNN